MPQHPALIVAASMIHKHYFLSFDRLLGVLGVLGASAAHLHGYRRAGLPVRGAIADIAARAPAWAVAAICQIIAAFGAAQVHLCHSCPRGSACIA